ncbi:DEKNAAC102746 [Brettanomyces naardenensis]|uniref:DEKNAAC102746 n=1 Tax=Brettanomyces naardenensis TaxID=13370 RepID=A0A448YKV6_BRENA|nr:DEKNAAC102746 [Brettanomyces naardenensis]
MNPSFDFTKLPGTEDPWGPSKEVPQALRFNDVPYAPFSKTDKLGKVADWQQAREDELPKRYQDKRRDQYHAYGASAAKLFGAEAEQEDFSIVDNNPQPVNKQAVLRGRRGLKPGEQGSHQFNGPNNRRFNNRDGQGSRDGNRDGNRDGRNQGRYNNTNAGGYNNRDAPNSYNNNNNYNNNNGGNNYNNGNQARGGGFNNRGGRYGNQGGGFRWNRGNRFYNRDEQNKNRAPSIKISPDWKLVTEIELNKLTKLNLVVSKPETVSSYGTVNVYSKKFELFKPEPLRPVNRSIVNPTTSDDPVIKDYASGKKATVFATDSILAQLMCVVRSAYSWDIVVTKRDGVIYFDRREGTDKLEVDENAAWPPMDTDKNDINSSTKLSLEATYINHNFVANSLENAVHKLENPENPFATEAQDSAPLLNRGYKYVKYLLPTDDDEKPLELILRAQIDAYQPEGKLVSINALNQYNPTPADDWNTKLISGSRGVIFAGQLKNNNNKIARWAAQSILGGLDSMKIGFVTRKTPKDNIKHVVAGALTFTPEVLSAQINLSVGNGWGIVKSLIDIIDHEGGDEDYKFVIFRAPGVSKLAIYKVPLDTFDTTN